MNKLMELLSKCKCSVSVEVNKHRDYYQTAQQALEEMDGYKCPPEIEADVRKKMIELNTIVDIQFYPDTPIGFYKILHYDLEMALDEALKCLTRPRED